VSDFDAAIELNDRGLALRDAGDLRGAEAAYLAAMEAAPSWPAPIYNLGLLYKYECRWKESFDYNRRSTELQSDDEASWWNFGIAATALRHWGEARRAWAACGIEVPPGDGPPEFNWGRTPVRLNPDTDGEVVWARRLDPARAQILNVPLPISGFRWGDIVLNDGAVEGERMVNGRAYPVFNVLQRWQLSPFRTFILELATADGEALAALERCAADRVALLKIGVHARRSFAETAVTGVRMNMPTATHTLRIHTVAWRLVTTLTPMRSSLRGLRLFRPPISRYGTKRPLPSRRWN